MARPKRGDETSPDSVLEAAAAVFAARGYAGATLDDVARRLGITRQAVLHHFAGKEALFRAVLERDRRWAERLALSPAVAEADPDSDSDSDSSPLASLARFLGLDADARARVRLQHVLTGEAIAGNAVAREHVAERNRVVRAEVAARVQRAVELGLVAPGWNPTTLTTVVIALISGLQSTLLLDPETPVGASFDRAIAEFSTERQPAP